MKAITILFLGSLSLGLLTGCQPENAAAGNPAATAGPSASSSEPAPLTASLDESIRRQAREALRNIERDAQYDLRQSIREHMQLYNGGAAYLAAAPTIDN
jgi:hypothetical protein